MSSLPFVLSDLIDLGVEFDAHTLPHVQLMQTHEVFWGERHACRCMHAVCFESRCGDIAVQRSKVLGVGAGHGARALVAFRYTLDAAEHHLSEIFVKNHKASAHANCVHKSLHPLQTFLRSEATLTYPHSRPRFMAAWEAT